MHFICVQENVEMSLVICENASASVPRTACMAWAVDAGGGQLYLKV